MFKKTFINFKYYFFCMKKLFVLSLIAIFFGNLSAQNPASEMFEIDKQTVPGYTMSFVDKSVNLVNSAFKFYLEKINGLKSGKGAANGFVGYQKQILQPLSMTANLDIYYKVVEEGKKNAKTTKLYFAFKTFATANEVATVETNSIKFLNDFLPQMSKFENEEKLKIAQGTLEKLQKENEKLKKEKTGIEKNLKDKENEIVNKENDIKNAEAEVERLKTVLFEQ